MYRLFKGVCMAKRCMATARTVPRMTSLTERDPGPARRRTNTVGS